MQIYVAGCQMGALVGYQFIESVGPMLQQRFGEHQHPRWWSGFNACMTGVPGAGPANRVLLAVRLARTEAMRRPIVPGIRNTPQHRALPWTRESDLSDGFMWGTPYAVDVSCVMVGTFDDAHGFRPDPAYAPYMAHECSGRFLRVPDDKKTPVAVPAWIAQRQLSVPCQDLRIFAVGEHVYMHDAYAMFVSRVRIDEARKRVVVEKWAPALCMERPASTPKATPYLKYFDKNWSFVGSAPDGSLMFMDWFYEPGVRMVFAAPGSGACHRMVVVPFRKDVIPKEPTDTMPGFSFGSTTLQLGRGTKYVDALGVGHVKFMWRHMLRPKSALYRSALEIDAQFVNRFGAHYKRHYKSVYASYFFRLKQSSPSKFTLTMSDLWIPMFEKETARYHSLISFPMGVIAADGDKHLLVSGGLTDCYNVLMKFDREAVLKSLVHDAGEMDLSKLRLGIQKI